MPSLDSWQQQVRDWFAASVATGLAAFARDLAVASPQSTTGGHIISGGRQVDWGAKEKQGANHILIVVGIGNGEGTPHPAPPTQQGSRGKTRFSPQSSWNFLLGVYAEGETDDDAEAQIAEVALNRILAAIQARGGFPPLCVDAILNAVGSDTESTGEVSRFAEFIVVKKEPF